MGPFLKQKMLIARRVLLGGRLRLQSRRAAHLNVGGGSQSVRPGPSLARAVAEDEHYMRLALDEARVARDLGEVPVGAVLVDDEGEVMARAHNTVETSTDPTAHAEMLCLRQASKRLESWRLLEVSWTPTTPPRRRGELGTDARKTPGTPSLSRRPRSSSHWSLARCEFSFVPAHRRKAAPGDLSELRTPPTSSSLSRRCAGALLQSRVKRVVWGAPNKQLGADGSWISILSSSETDTKHPYHLSVDVTRNVLREECSALLVDFFRRRREQNQEKRGEE